jgi:hypothetical protein
VPAASHAAASFSIFGFSLRWPPAIVSSHLGPLNLFSPLQLLVALFEIGPVIIFTPWITAWALRKAKQGDWVFGALAFSAWVGFLMPVLLEYQADRDISRLAWQALLTWTIMLVLMLPEVELRWPGWARLAGVGTLALMVFGGVVVTGSQMTAMTTTQLAHRFNELDAEIAAEVWDELPRDAKVFGPLGHTTILTGRLTGVLLGDPPHWELEDWNRLMEVPTLDEFVRQEYDFIFLDNRWLDSLPPQSQEAFDAACIQVVAEAWDDSGVNFRKVLDLRDCE